MVPRTWRDTAPRRGLLQCVFHIARSAYTEKEALHISLYVSPKVTESQDSHTAVHVKCLCDGHYTVIPTLPSLTFQNLEWI